MLLSDRDVAVSFMELVAAEVNSNIDDGSVETVFRPALDVVRLQLKHLSLSRSDLMVHADFLIAFSRLPCLAEVCITLIS